MADRVRLAGGGRPEPARVSRHRMGRRSRAHRARATRGAPRRGPAPRARSGRAARAFPRPGPDRHGTFGPDDRRHRHPRLPPRRCPGAGGGRVRCARAAMVAFPEGTSRSAAEGEDVPKDCRLGGHHRARRSLRRSVGGAARRRQAQPHRAPSTGTAQTASRPAAWPVGRAARGGARCCHHRSRTEGRDRGATAGRAGAAHGARTRRGHGWSAGRGGGGGRVAR